MKSSTAKLSFLRQSPRKVREVARLIRRKNVVDAVRILSFTDRRASASLKKLLLSALSNLGQDTKNLPSNVFVSELLVDEGPVSKRWMPRAQGRATPINKRTSHIKITLKEKVF